MRIRWVRRPSTLLVVIMLFGTTILPSSLFASDYTEAAILAKLIQMYFLQEQMQDTASSTQRNTVSIASNTAAQLKELRNEWQKLSQSYGMADAYGDQSARLWSSDDWNAVLQQASGGNSARLQQLMQSYSKMYPRLKKGGQPIDPETLTDTTYQQSGETYNAALSTSAYTYDDINNQIKKIESLLAQVDNTSKNQNIKSSMDLNSRLVAELSFIQLQMLKLQSVHTQMDATKNQAEFNADTLDKQFVNYQLNK